MRKKKEKKKDFYVESTRVCLGDWITLVFF